MPSFSPSAPVPRPVLEPFLSHVFEPFIPLSRFLPLAPDTPSHRADARRALAGEMATVGQLLVAQQDGPLPPDLEQRFRVGTWFAPPPSY